MVENLILSAIEKVENCWNGVICFGYREDGDPYWTLAVGDYEVYKSPEFKKIVHPYQNKARDKYKQLLVVVYQNPSEHLLTSLIDKRLILSI